MSSQDTKYHSFSLMNQDTNYSFSLMNQEKKREEEIPITDKNGAQKWSRSSLGISALLLLLAVRISGVFLTLPIDCDEVFNFLEPLHFIHYGVGFQTWETSPQFALRSYFYLLPYHGALFIFDYGRQILNYWQSIVPFLPAHNTSNVLAFFFLRAVVALCYVFAELSLSSALSTVAGRKVALGFLFVSIFSPGTFFASNQVLPTTAFVVLEMLAFAALLRKQFRRAILFSVIAVTWTTNIHGGVLFIPFALLIMSQFGLLRSIVWGLQCALCCCLLSVAVDTLYYGRCTWSVWNWVRYNVLEDRSSLYGVEQRLFYMQNLILNFGVFFPVAILGIVSMSVRQMRDWFRLLCKWTEQHTPKRDLVVGTIAVPSISWIVLLSNQPHKEERFMVPIYPMVCLGASVGMCHVDILVKMAVRFMRKRWFRFPGMQYLRRIVLGGTAVSSIFFFVLRCAAICRYFTLSVLSVWLSVSGLSSSKHLTVCTAQEWYRFPSSFFLPSYARLGFVDVGFEGILPSYFESTARQASAVNDRNQREVDRYTKYDDCDFLIDSTAHVKTLDEAMIAIPDVHGYRGSSDELKTLKCDLLLDLEWSPRLSRSFHMPGMALNPSNSYRGMCFWQKGNQLGFFPENETPPLGLVTPSVQDEL